MEGKIKEMEKQAIMVIVQFGTQMMIGMGCEDILFKPRIIMRDQDGRIILSTLFGEPEFMQIGTYWASWEPKMNSEIRLLYTQEATGLILTRPGQKIPDIIKVNPKA